MHLCQAAPLKSGLPAYANVAMHSGLFLNQWPLFALSPWPGIQGP